MTAREKLDGVAQAAGNAASADYYARYLSLSEAERIQLLQRVVILSAAATGEQLTEQLVATVRKAAVERRRRPLIDRLRGWWHGRTIAHLAKVAHGEVDWIDMSEIEDQLHLIAQTLRDDNLPLDYGDEPKPTSDEVDGDDRVFVEQLKIILLHHERIRQAVYDHNRAFLQRSRWQREQLVAIGELDKYDRRLIEEWERVFLPLDAEPDGDKADKRMLARTTYGRLQERPLPEIRTGVQSGYMPLGSLHILADRLQIGWHPDWVNLLKHRLAEARGVTETAEVA